MQRLCIRIEVPQLITILETCHNICQLTDQLSVEIMIDAGLDLGNKNCVLAIPQNGGVDIVASASGKRITPTLVGYAETRRYWGELAANNQMQNLSTTISDLKRLVGLKFESSEREFMEKTVQFKMAALPDGLTGVEIDGRVTRPEQSIAFVLEEILKMATAHDHRAGGFVIAVSPWWGELHRRLILDAMKIARIPCAALVNSTTAAAVTYAINHRARLPEKGSDPVSVLLIDFGDSSMNVCVSRINREEIHIVSFACDEHLGGSHFTEALVSYLADLVKTKHGVDVMQNPRTTLRFRKAVETAKKNLSVNPVVSFELQDSGISFPLKREEFQNQIGHLIARIEAPIEKALELADTNKSDLFAAEVLGGGSRVPAVKAEIQRILGREPTQSLNLDECFATGTGFVSAILCPSFRISLDVHDISPHALTCEWEDAEGAKECELFAQFSVVPSTASIRIAANGPVVIRVKNESGLVGTVTVETEASQDTKEVSLNFLLGQSSVVEVTNVLLSDGAPIPFHFDCVLGLSPAEIAELQRDNDRLRARDTTELSIDNVKNELESLLFKVENGIKRDFPECFAPDSLESTRATIASIREWFDEHEFERLHLNDYRQKFDELSKVAADPIKRHALFTQILDAGPQFLSQAQQMLESLSELATRDKKQKPLVAELTGFVSELKETMAAVEAMPRYTTPNVSFDSISKKLEEWDRRVCVAISAAQPKGWCVVA